jgi:hypothetical protein
MPPQTLAARTERLEERVTALEQLPARIDALTSQVSQLREEMHAEFSALREHVRVGDEDTRRSLVEEIRLGDEETRRMLRDEIRAGDEETRRHARVLHEEILSRLTLIQEGGDRSSKQS